MHAPWYREPFVHFLALGALVFALDAWRNDDAPAQPSDDRRIIELDPARRARTRADFRKRIGRDPSPEEAKAALQRVVDEEILHRRALELGLDRNDLIVRRRLVQKMRFLIEDVHPVEPPSEADLAAWLASHSADYRVPSRVSFEQVFFSRSGRGDDLEADARAGLATLTADPAAPVGDPFYLGRRFVERSVDALAGSFGRTFADAVMGAETTGAWVGPLRSSFGMHLVRVSARHEPRAATLEEVRARVTRDLKAHRRAQANEAALEDLRGRFTVRPL
jgi:peptidyl-prolyl cis-trans isomerase C